MRASGHLHATRIRPDLEVMHEAAGHDHLLVRVHVHRPTEQDVVSAQYRINELVALCKRDPTFLSLIHSCFSRVAGLAVSWVGNAFPRVAYIYYVQKSHYYRETTAHTGKLDANNHLTVPLIIHGSCAA